ncbi:SIR2-like domain-containing protein [Rhodospira trueperi]|uniref:SIR2-like domain-containing protein n=1 Tax=Rhodospira trueperi TaxID=69960 RepID=A0A1G7FCF5_9PROT|nr:SIR2-like domain-containing protein [Rhodospira trueperi]
MTYLHGKVQKDEDPNGEGLILTSADFGAAYLRDGWAARFVVELFREFTVLFVGYSLNDPIVSYLVDALAADMHAGGQFRRAFVLAPYGNAAGEREKVVKSWDAKGIVPLPFNRGQKYGRQTRVLTAWAKEYRQGLNSRISVALEPTRRPFPPPLPDVEVKSILNNIAWALSKPDGSVAKHFADGNPSPDPTWLAPLSEVEIPLREGQAPARLFDWPSPTLGADGIEKPHLAPLAGEGAACLTSLPLSPITFELGRWLAQHRASRNVSDWVISRGGQLHPFLAQRLNFELETLAQPYQAFWRIVISGALLRPCFPGRLFPPRLTRYWPPDGGTFLLRAAQPYLTVRKPFRLGGSKEPPGRVSDLADFDVVLTDEDLVRDVYDHRTEDHVTEAVVRLADPLTSSLFDVCRLAEEAEVFGLTEHSVVWVPCLASDDDEVIRRWHGPLLLLRLLVVALPAIVRSDMEAGLVLVRRWMVLGRQGHALFQRLALHALTETDAVPMTDAVQFVLGGDGTAFWHFQTWPELARFLRARAASFGSDDLNALVRSIEGGPPEGLFSTQPGHDLVRRLRGERLGKLKQGGAELPAPLVALAREFETQPDVLVGKVETGWVVPATAEDIAHLPPTEAAERLLAYQDDWDQGHALSDLFAKNEGLWFDVLPLLIERGASGSLWGIGLAAPRELKDDQTISRIIVVYRELAEQHPRWLADEAVAAVADCLDSWGKQVSTETELHAFLPLWDLAWAASTQNGKSDLLERPDGVDTAINAPGGRLAGALLKRLLLEPVTADGGLPPLLKPFFDRSAHGETHSHRFARIMYASHLVWLHRLDRAWTKESLIRPMETASPEERLSLWEGYLWQPYWNEHLLSDLADALFAILPHMREREETVGDALGRFLGDVYLTKPNTVLASTRHKPSLLTAFFSHAGPSERAAMARALGARMKDAGDQAPILWSTSVGPLIRDHWPADHHKNNIQVSTGFADVLLNARNAFPEAVDFLLGKNLITSKPGQRNEFLDHFLLLLPLKGEEDEEIRHKDNAVLYPEHMLRLLDAATEGGIASWHTGRISTLLRQIKKAQPDLANSPVFVRLKERAGGA